MFTLTSSRRPWACQCLAEIGEGGVHRAPDCEVGIRGAGQPLLRSGPQTRGLAASWGQKRRERRTGPKNFRSKPSLPQLVGEVEESASFLSRPGTIDQDVDCVERSHLVSRCNCSHPSSVARSTATGGTYLLLACRKSRRRPVFPWSSLVRAGDDQIGAIVGEPSSDRPADAPWPPPVTTATLSSRGCQNS